MLVRVGHVLGPFGVRGLLKCEYTTDLPELLERRPELMLVDVQSSECLVPGVAEVQLKSTYFLVRFNGFDTPEPLARFKGWDLHYPVNRGELPREEGEVYYFELAGMEVRRPTGFVLGVVQDVLRTGAHPVLQLKFGNRELLIPYVKEHIPEVNVSAGWLITTYPLEQYGIKQ